MPSVRQKGARTVSIAYVNDEALSIDKAKWHGIAVYAEQENGQVHNVALELIGKVKELAKSSGQPVYALMIGSKVTEPAQTLLRYGIDKVFVYDAPPLANFKIDVYANVFADFIHKVKPSAIMVGATNLGRTLAPRVAARLRTGLTADCTRLEIKENSDLVQIRPAFGGNIMAQIVTPRHRPQFCTVRYKIFSAPEPETEVRGRMVPMTIEADKLQSLIQILEIKGKPREVEISEAEIVVTCGRGFKKREDLALAEELAELLGGVVAGTRPVVEAGWLDPKRQIGLSGRTTKPKLIITLGVSGSVQFVAGMRGSDCIIAVNQDESAAIFDVAHYGLVGDIYEIVPGLVSLLKGE